MLTLDDPVPLEIAAITGWLSYRNINWAELDYIAAFSQHIIDHPYAHNGFTLREHAGRLQTISIFRERHFERVEAQKETETIRNRANADLMNCLDRMEKLESVARLARSLLLNVFPKQHSLSLHNSINTVLSHIDTLCPTPAEWETEDDDL